MSARACQATYGDRCADRSRPHTPTSSSCPPLAGARDRRFLMSLSNWRDSLRHNALKLFHVPLLLPLGSSLSRGSPSLLRSAVIIKERKSYNVTQSRPLISKGFLPLTVTSLPPLRHTRPRPPPNGGRPGLNGRFCGILTGCFSRNRRGTG